MDYNEMEDNLYERGNFINNSKIEGEYEIDWIPSPNGRFLVSWIPPKDLRRRALRLSSGMEVGQSS